MSYKKDQVIADQQKSLKATEKALAEARGFIAQAHRSLASGNTEEAQNILGNHLKNIGLA